MVDDDNIKKLPVQFKKRGPEDRSLLLPYEAGKRSCQHIMVQYIVNEREAECECGTCGAKLNPMFVLSQLAIHDMRMHKASARYHDELKRLADRSRTKCDKCGHMTRISRR